MDSARLGALFAMTAPTPYDPPARADLAVIADRILLLRRHRDALFGSLFGEPAWEALLHVYIAAATNKVLSVADLAAKCGVAVALAARIVIMLEHTGQLTCRRPAPGGGETTIALTSIARCGIETFLEDARSLG